MSVQVIPCDGLERTRDGDYFWDGLQPLRGGRSFTGRGGATPEHVILSEL